MGILLSVHYAGVGVIAAVRREGRGGRVAEGDASMTHNVIAHPLQKGSRSFTESTMRSSCGWVAHSRAATRGSVLL